VIEADRALEVPRESGRTAVVRVERVTKRFGSVTAVDDVSFEVAAGEFFSLLGPSGCGKTTTLRMLAGFEVPTQGRIYLEGKDATNTPPYKRATNLVFQNYALFPHMTVEENVAFGPQRRRLPRAEVRERVREALATVRLEGMAERYPRELSGGQQQRVALARALANRPAVLLLDEPLGALDLKLREEMQLELKRIQREVGICFVYVTHDQGEALTMSDRVAVMNHGRIEQIGSPEEVYERPATRFVAGFIGTANLVPCTVEEAGDVATVRLLDGGRVGAPAAPGCAVGSRAVLMLRPERLRIRTAPESTGGPGMRGRVVESVFQGSVLRHLVQVGERSIVVLAPVGADRPGIGQEVWVSWDASDGYVLPAEEGGSG
jgi:spermidine/putrescine transport system ATP-binding protein